MRNLSEELIKDEEILTERKPHFLSFWPYYLYFFWYALISGVFLWKLPWFEQIIANSFIGSFFGLWGVNIAFLLLWWLMMVIPALIYSILMIEWRWVLGFVFLTILGTFLFYRYQVPKRELLYGTVGLAFIGFVLSDIYRRGHHFRLTSFRIIMELGFFGSTTRQIPYSQISDLIMKQGLLGKIFNYGTVLPITPSEIATGSDEAGVMVGTSVSGGAGGKGAATGAGAGIGVIGTRSMKVPRGQTFYVLYGIPNPEEMQQEIVEKMREKEPAQAIDRETRILGKKLDELIEKDEKSKTEKKEAKNEEEATNEENH